MDKSILEVVHETAKDLHKAGLISETTMQKFDAVCKHECKHEWEHHFIEFTANDQAEKKAPTISDISVCVKCNAVAFLRGITIHCGDTAPEKV